MLLVRINTRSTYRGPDRQDFERSKLAELVGLVDEDGTPLTEDVYVQFLDGLSDGGLIEMYLDEELADRLQGSDEAYEFRRYLADSVKKYLDVDHVVFIIHKASTFSMTKM